MTLALFRSRAAGTSRAAARGRSGRPGWPARAWLVPACCRIFSLRELGHLLRHVHVADARLGGGQVLLVVARLCDGVLEPVLHRTEVGAGRARRCSMRGVDASVTSIETRRERRAATERSTPTAVRVVAPSRSLPLAPTWKVTIVGVDAPNSAMPLNFVPVADARRSPPSSCATSARDRGLVVGRQRAVRRLDLQVTDALQRSSAPRSARLPPSARARCRPARCAAPGRGRRSGHASSRRSRGRRRRRRRG